jgi:hypothetical protein
VNTRSVKLTELILLFDRGVVEECSMLTRKMRVRIMQNGAMRGEMLSHFDSVRQAVTWVENLFMDVFLRSNLFEWRWGERGWQTNRKAIREVFEKSQKD